MFVIELPVTSGKLFVSAASLVLAHLGTFSNKVGMSLMLSRALSFQFFCMFTTVAN